MKDLMKTLLPELVQRFLHRQIWDPGRNFLWRTLKLQYVLRSGINVVVKSPADWVIYNEVLVNGEYDSAITHAIERSGDDEIRVLDLGANVGYFIFRCADLFFQNTHSKRLSIIAVEGAPGAAAELSHRIGSEVLLRDHVRVIHGLVGERSGSAYISDSANHYGNSIADRQAFGSAEVTYVDIATVIGLETKIDLLKCDIEGSEFIFVKNYPDLLSRVSTAVFEFHKYGEDVEELRLLLGSYGFQRRAILREAPLFSIEVFDRF